MDEGSSSRQVIRPGHENDEMGAEGADERRMQDGNEVSHEGSSNGIGEAGGQSLAAEHVVYSGNTLISKVIDDIRRFRDLEKYFVDMTLSSLSRLTVDILVGWAKPKDKARMFDLLTGTVLKNYVKAEAEERARGQQGDTDSNGKLDQVLRGVSHLRVQVDDMESKLDKTHKIISTHQLSEAAVPTTVALQTLFTFLDGFSMAPDLEIERVWNIAQKLLNFDVLEAKYNACWSFGDRRDSKEGVIQYKMNILNTVVTAASKDTVCRDTHVRSRILGILVDHAFVAEEHPTEQLSHDDAINRMEQKFGHISWAMVDILSELKPDMEEPRRKEAQTQLVERTITWKREVPDRKIFPMFMADLNSLAFLFRVDDFYYTTTVMPFVAKDGQPTSAFKYYVSLLQASPKVRGLPDHWTPPSPFCFRGADYQDLVLLAKTSHHSVFKSEKHQQVIKFCHNVQEGSVLPEVKALTTLTGTANVPSLLTHGFFLDQNYVLIESPFAASGTLRVAKFGFEAFFRCVLTIATVLRTAHNLGVCHRDPKPSNILCIGESVLLNDWSAAVLLENDAISLVETSFVGTPMFASRIALNENVYSFDGDYESLFWTMLWFASISHDQRRPQHKSMELWHLTGMKELYNAKNSAISNDGWRHTKIYLVSDERVRKFLDEWRNVLARANPTSTRKFNKGIIEKAEKILQELQKE